MRIRAVLVPLDGTVASQAALPVAATLSRLEDATMHVLHVGERVLPPRERLEELGLAPEDLQGCVLDQATGPPAGAILRLARKRQDALIVLCTHTAAGKPRGALGSVAEEVLLRAPCPVVLVQPQRGLHRWELRRILLPLDGTPTTAAAMDPAGDLAELAGAEVLVLHVAEAGAARPAEPGTITVPRYLDQPQHEWPAWAHEFIERMSALGHPPAEVRFRLFMAAGEPAREIVRVLEEHDADLVVAAWHGRWEEERALTLKELIRESDRPVLTLKV